ncbi:hypothetical protein [Rhodobacter maris]|uniref:Uncharacterized protein n=1 Tax=Rhodobacter maris TaxID=446682 RepID=A0A285SBD5_9RHOB|nr:hypothetical protein [Rhodobacter maris]SOC04940.1 hypothetical protein SAMN05877831_10470 [Rhodobacter maris]
MKKTRYPAAAVVTRLARMKHIDPDTPTHAEMLAPLTQHVAEGVGLDDTDRLVVVLKHHAHISARSMVTLLRRHQRDHGLRA